MFIILNITLAVLSTIIQRTNSQLPFPLEKFLNISHLFDKSRFRYLENGTAKFKFNKYFEQRDLLSNWKRQILCGKRRYTAFAFCDCHPRCMEFRTCCADAFWNNISYSTDIESYTRKFQSDALQQKNYKCSEAFPFARNGGYESESYYMVTTCPKDKIDSNENELCTSLNTTLGSSTIPVLGSDKHLYKNVYCAECHGVDEFDIVQIRLNCKTDKSSCRLSIKHDNGKQCNPLCHFKGDCKPGNKYYERCYSHAGNYKGYDNIFCYECAKGEITELSRPLVVVKGMCFVGAVIPYPYSWFSLLTLSDSNDRDIERGCLDKQIFSLLTNGCLRLSCPDGFKAIKSKCIKMISKETKTIKKANHSEYFDDAFMSNCLIKKQTRLYVMGISDLNRFMNASFLSYLSKDSTILSVHEKEENNSKQSAIIVELNNMTKGLKTFILSDTGLAKSKFLIENSSILIGSQIAPFQYPQKLNFSNIFMNDNICEKPLLLDNNNITFSNSCHASYRGETIDNHNLSVWIDIRSKELRKLIYTCKSHLLKLCPYRLNKINYLGGKRKTLNSSTINVTNVILNKDYRCASSVQETVWYTTVGKVSGYVSFVGSMLSMVSYTFLIVTFNLFRELKNLPGYCVLSMSINLFLADILYVLGTVLYMVGFSGPLNVCLPIGSLMHLFLLSGQFWSVVMAIDVSLNVFLAKLVSSTGTKKKFIIYCLITYSLAIAFAAVGVLSNWIDLLDAKYNENNICALSGFYARMILYFIPLAISTVIGTSVLCVSICVASKTNRENTKTLGNDTRRKKINFTNIALKLVIICGLSEAIGFIQVYKANHLTNSELLFNSAFGFLYSVTKGFRGVLLCIMYLYNERVKKFYRGMFSRKTQSASDNEMTNMSFNKSS